MRLRHRALPGRDLADVALACELLGARLRAPLLISAMTGGAAAATEINRRLAEAAAEHGVALVLGSGRPLLDDPALLPTYRAPGSARPPLLLANLGAAQVRGPGRPTAPSGSSTCSTPTGCRSTSTPCRRRCSPRASRVRRRARGHRRGRGAARAAARWSSRRSASASTPRTCARSPATGVAAVDVAGAGGTNWALIEGRRDTRAGAVAAAFGDWGMPTADALAGALPAPGCR